MTADATSLAEKYNPGERLAIKCQRCAENMLNVTVQQARVMGWRIWSGTVASGEEREVIACPACAVGAGVNAAGDLEGFDAECSTCGAAMSEEDDWDDPDDPPTEADAKQWCRDHECEPCTSVIRPTPRDTRPAAVATAREVHGITPRGGVL